MLLFDKRIQKPESVSAELPLMEWSQLSEYEILSLRFSDLDLKFVESRAHLWVQEVCEDLAQRDLLFQTRFYFGDEWFSPEGVPAISIPFYLAHPRLLEIHRKFGLEVEGADERDFKRLLRHELGHVFDHLFRVSKRQRWREIFGTRFRRYNPESYHPNPESKNFVKNLDDHYAQAHPDEDFAETFAVWLDPQSNWKETYRDWPAFQKLLYVDSLAAEFRGISNEKVKGRLMSDVRYMKRSLFDFYQAGTAALQQSA